MKKVLIFGAEGFAGGYLADEFKEHGYTVYGSGLTDIKDTSNMDGTFHCDITDPDRVREIVSSVNATHIVNLAAVSNVGQSWKIPQTTVDVNVNGALNILEAVRENNYDTKILLIGSSEEYNSAEGPMDETRELGGSNPYGVSKVMLEKFSSIYRDYYGMKVYHVRAFNHTGIGQGENFIIPSWCSQAADISLSKKPGVMRVGNLDLSRDFCNIRDVVRAYRLIIESDDCHEIYNVGSGQAVPLRKILEYIISLSDQPITIETDPELIRPSENPVTWCDHGKITEKLGWEPQYTIFDTVREVFDYYANRENKSK
ncbi:GDP-mannose 4,6-dehydratase [Butyrivibrio sp. AE3004]|uniref:GDP-mannose 4,6-dehydratase n=1 Tax=Butyrivibrio sp. AE3004 TaxID=1506994 RepID=UPI000494C0F0|nr:GDP-mannose 4,6-dehydratase [Butyrivibrio sp. AE3004]